MFLGSEQIKKLILEQELVKDYIDLEKQLQPNGFDLTVKSIEKLTIAGAIYVNDKVTPSTEKVLPVGDIWLLDKGSYLVYFNEIINLPKGLAAVHIQRSTVMRCGALSIVGSWDSGYKGRGCSLLVVENENGIQIQKNARIVQMHFIPVSGEIFTYNGNYQNENIEEVRK